MHDEARETAAEPEQRVGVIADDGRRLPPAKAVPHLTTAERDARGKAARADVPRSAHAGWEPPSVRHDPVGLLEQQGATRVPELLPIRYGRMLLSPFAFYRGAAKVMAADLAGSPRTGLTVQLCGDAHLSNFGAFLSPDRRLTFSINDFDETLPGPFEWDVKRLVASFAVVGRENGLTPKERERVNRRLVRAYREAMASFAGMRDLDVWYAHLDVDALVERARLELSRKQIEQIERNVARARARDSLKAFDKLVHLVDGRPRITADPPLVVPVEDLVDGASPETIEEGMRTIIRSYRRSLQGDRRRLLERFRYVHMARKVVGVGSVGSRAFIVLLLGRDERDPLFLQVKQAEASVLEPFLGKSRHASSGQRVVEGQRLMQSASDILLGWIRARGVDGVTRDFYVRQLWDGKGSADVETMDAERLVIYARMCGWTLARAHARSGDAIAIASYMGTGDSFDRALAAFAEDYADQTESDHAALRAAANAGRIVVQEGL